MLIAFTYLAGVRWTDLHAILNTDVGPNGNVWNERTVWLLCLCIVRNFVYYCVINCSIIVASLLAAWSLGFAQNHCQAMLSFFPSAGIRGCSHISRITSDGASSMNKHVGNISFNYIFCQCPCATFTNRHFCSWTNMVQLTIYQDLVCFVFLFYCDFLFNSQLYYTRSISTIKLVSQKSQNYKKNC